MTKKTSITFQDVLDGFDFLEWDAETGEPTEIYGGFTQEQLRTIDYWGNLQRIKKESS